MNRLTVTSVRTAKKGTPHYWEKFAFDHGWPVYTRFYEHSRQAGQMRQFYKDRTYLKQTWATGPRDLDVILLNDNNTKQGTAGEIVNLDLVTARNLIEVEDAVLDTEANRELYGILLDLDISTETSTVSIPMRRLKHALSLGAGGLDLKITKKMLMNSKNNILIEKIHFVRMLEKAGIIVKDLDVISGLWIRENVYEEISFTPEFLADFTEGSDKVRLELDVNGVLYEVPVRIEKV